MKRDKELMITMLHQIKKDVNFAKQKYQKDEEYMYHLYLLKDGGYVEADWITTLGKNGNSHIVMEIKITFKGHECISLYSDRSIIEEVKGFLKERGTTIDGIPFPILDKTAKKIVENKYKF